MARNYYFDLDRLKSIPIVDVARLLNIEIKNKMALCFAGHDTVPSLSFTPERNLWYCFGCKRGGTNIQLVKYYFNISDGEAIQWLAEQFSIAPISKASANKLTGKKHIHKQIAEKSKKVDSNIYQPDSEIYNWIIEKCGLSTKAYDYLINNRKYKRSTIDYFQIKSISYPQKLFYKMRNLWDLSRLINCGLVYKNKQGNYGLIWWKPVIIFPFWIDNKIKYLQGRSLDNANPKYINLKGIKKPIFHSQILDNIKPLDRICICEGIPDTMMAYQYGWNAIGVLGTSTIDPVWIEKMLELEIIVIPDSDLAGENFAEAIKKAFAQYGKLIRSVLLTNKKDLAEFLKGQ